LVYEVVDNAIDEAPAGFCDKIILHSGRDGTIAVEDNGRGIPTVNASDRRKVCA